LLRQLKRKIVWKPVWISGDLLIQTAICYFVQFCQVGIQHHAQAADHSNRLLDVGDFDRGVRNGFFLRQMSAEIPVG